MKTKVIGLFLLLFTIPCIGQRTYKYPLTEKKEISDTIFGKIVNDPYRWLEDLFSEKTRHWLKTQEKFKESCQGYTYEYLSNFLYFYSDIDYKPLIKEGKYFFLYRSIEEDKTPSLYYQANEDKGPRFLFNPNRLDNKSTVNLDQFSISEDNNRLSLTLSYNSGDWKTIRFLDMDTKHLLEDTIRYVKYGRVYWSGNGVFYCKYDVQNILESFTGTIKGKALYYHRIGTRQAGDILIYKPDDDGDDFDYEVSPSKKYLVLYRSKVIKDRKVNTVSLLTVSHFPAIEFRDFIISKQPNIHFQVIGELNNHILVETNLNAPNGAIYRYDPSRINQGTIFIPQTEEKLEYSKLIGGRLLRIYNDNRISYAVVSDTAGLKLTEWEIPEGYRFSRFYGSFDDSIALYYFNSFYSPSSIYKINLNSFVREPLGKTRIWFDNKDLITEKIYYPSKDSTLIPMYITHLKNLTQNGNNPTILYGYGGFGISMEPFFDVANIIFLKNGGILATPCLRGGGEFPGWHEKGMRLNKQNTFDDFISAAEYLVSNKFTNPAKIAAMGGSHGGLVVGACAIQRPDLFKVVIAESAVLDMMRKEHYNIGYSYREEYGSIYDSIEFRNLLRYSPVNNVRENVSYPAMLLVASDNDDRVLPFHSFKFISELQAKGSKEKPYVLYYQRKAGHTGSDLFGEEIKAKAYIYSFVYKQLGMEKAVASFDY